MTVFSSVFLINVFDGPISILSKKRKIKKIMIIINLYNHGIYNDHNECIKKVNKHIDTCQINGVLSLLSLFIVLRSIGWLISFGLTAL